MSEGLFLLQRYSFMFGVFPPLGDGSATLHDLVQESLALAFLGQPGPAVGHSQRIRAIFFGLRHVWYLLVVRRWESGGLRLCRKASLDHGVVCRVALDSRQTLHVSDQLKKSAKVEDPVFFVVMVVILDRIHGTSSAIDLESHIVWIHAVRRWECRAMWFDVGGSGIAG